MPRFQSKYSAQQSSEIRFNIIGALDELAVSRGIDIKTMQTTAPYSFVLNGLPSQKIAAELKKMIDVGMVVKSAAKGQTMKYMLKTQYNALFKEGKMKLEKFGYGDYRDNQISEEEENERESEAACARISASVNRIRYEPEW